VVLAVALAPLVAWLERRHVGRGLATLLVGLGLFGAVAVTVALLVPSLGDQARLLGVKLDQLEEMIRRSLPAPIASALHMGGSGASGPQGTVSFVARYAWTAASILVSSVTFGLFAFILSLYLVLEGERTYRWLLAYVPRAQRSRADATAREARRLIYAYVVGNLITSAFASAFTVILLLALHVPAALILALLAGVFDLIPVLGFILFSVSAVAVAATVSPTTAVMVAAGYSGYHLFENYYLTPRVYGDQLRMSMVAVLLSFAVGAELGGVVGALVALPLAGAYPAVEQIWLRGHLARGTVDDHARIEREGE
jgi:predicted PurR-regulated permease PerM